MTRLPPHIRRARRHDAAERGKRSEAAFAALWRLHAPQRPPGARVTLCPAPQVAL